MGIPASEGIKTLRPSARSDGRWELSIMAATLLYLFRARCPLDLKIFAQPFLRLRLHTYDVVPPRADVEGFSQFSKHINISCARRGVVFGKGTPNASLLLPSARNEAV